MAALAGGASRAWAQRAGVFETRDLAYGTGSRRGIDVYRPVGATEPAPVAVFFHGGSWQTGDRSSYRFVGRSLAGQGVVCAVPDYRLYPEVRFPTFVQDGAAAVRWVRDRIGDHGGDPERIVVIGHSAGAHIAALLALDGRYMQLVGAAGAVRGLIGVAGPYDFLPIGDPILQRIFAVPGNPAITQPIHFARASAPPSLLITGDQDTAVLPDNTTRLAERLRAVGATVEQRILPGLGHIDIMLSFDHGEMQVPEPVLGLMVAFLNGIDHQP